MMSFLLFAFTLLSVTKTQQTNQDNDQCSCTINELTQTYITDEIISPSLANIRARCTYSILHDSGETDQTITPEQFESCTKAINLFQRTCHILGDNLAIYIQTKNTQNNKPEYEFHCINDCCSSQIKNYDILNNLDIKFYKNPNYDPQTNTVSGLHDANMKKKEDKKQEKPTCICSQKSFYSEKISVNVETKHKLKIDYQEFEDDIKPLKLPLPNLLEAGCFWFDDITHFIMCLFRTKLKMEIESFNDFIKFFRNKNNLIELMPYLSKKIEGNINDKEDLKELLKMVKGYSKGQMRQYFWKKVNMYSIKKDINKKQSEIDEYRKKLDWLDECCKGNNDKELKNEL